MFKTISIRNFNNTFSLFKTFSLLKNKICLSVVQQNKVVKYSYKK